MNQSVNLFLGAVLLWLALIPPAASRELYRYTDDQGRVQFSDRPPSAGNADVITVTPAAPLGTGGLRPGEKTLADDIEARRDAENRARRRADNNAARSNARKERKETQRIKEKCRRLTQKIATLDKRLRAGYRPSEGEKWRRERDQAQRDAFLLECR